jgi:hypothetical protein
VLASVTFDRYNKLFLWSKNDALFYLQDISSPWSHLDAALVGGPGPGQNEENEVVEDEGPGQNEESEDVEDEEGPGQNGQNEDGGEKIESLKSVHDAMSSLVPGGRQMVVEGFLRYP